MGDTAVLAGTFRALDKDVFEAGLYQSNPV
jgi:hypothetical protein